MDIDSLRAELEQHLQHNPDGQAPDGFRDRFDQCVEHLKAETDATDKAEHEAQLQQIRDEALAAAKAGGSGGEGAGGVPAKPRAQGEAEPIGRDPPGGPILAKGDPVVNPPPVEAPPPAAAPPVRGATEPVGRDPVGGPILAKGIPVASPAPVEAPPAEGGSKARFGIGIAVIVAIAAAAFFAYSAS